MSLNEKMTAIANKIRSILGITGSMSLDGMSSSLDDCQDIVNSQAALLDQAITAIANKSSGTKDPVLQSKNAYPSENVQVIKPDSGFDGLSSVEVGAIDNKYIGSAVNKYEENIYTPGKSDQVIPQGIYLNGDQIILGDADLVPENIRFGSSIFGVNGVCASDGVDTSDGNVTETDIPYGKIAYSKEGRIEGVLEEMPSDYGYAFNSDGIGIYENDDKNIMYVSSTMDARRIWNEGSFLTIEVPASRFGDATSDDVMSGKTFTSENGIKITGSYSPASGLPNGVANIASGTFTLSSDMNTHTIYHNLNAVPNFVFVSAIDSISDSLYNGYVFFHSMFVKKISMYGSDVEVQVYTASGYPDGVGVSPHYSWVSNANNYFNTNSIFLEPSDDSKKFKSGATYRWICGTIDV